MRVTSDEVVSPEGMWSEVEANPGTGWPHWVRQLTRALILTIGLLLIILPFLIESIALRRNAGLLVLSLGVLGLVVATGKAGLISLGHGAFVGLGAFAMGAFVDLVRLPYPLALAASFATCCLFGWLLGLIALRVKGIYLALITMGLAVVFPSVAKRFPSITGGTSGRPIENTLEAPAWTGFSDSQTITVRYYFCLMVCIAAFVLTRNLLQGRVGRAMQAVRDGETAAAAFGISIVRLKAGAFGYSAGLAGTAGALQVVLFPFVSHEQFNVFLSFRLYAAAVLGGIGAIIGAIYGVIAIVIVPTLNDVAGGLIRDDGRGLLDNDVIVFGVGLILLTFVSPDGFAGLLQRIGRRFSNRP